MQLLRAVNKILGRLGENPITSIENKNPTVTVILQAIEDESRAAQGLGWWFNTYEVKLYPGPGGKISTPAHLLSWECLDHPSTVRGEYIICTKTMTADWKALGVGSIRGKVTLYVEFDDLPHSFQEWVTARAAIRAYSNDLGVEDVVNLFMQEEQATRNKVMADHLRHKAYSTAKSPMFRRMTRYIWR